MVEDLHSSKALGPPMRYLLAGLLIPPFAWLLQMVIAETLAAQSCYPSSEPLSAPAVPWMSSALIAISAVCLGAGVVGSAIAWRNVRKIGPERWEALSDLNRRRAELARFLSRVALMCSALFLFALIATDVALAIVSPCRWW
jgi:hypothetical protein